MPAASSGGSSAATGRSSRTVIGRAACCSATHCVGTRPAARPARRSPCASGRGRRTRRSGRRTVPVRVGVTSITLSTPGMRSRLVRKSGTQNEWLTSTVCSRSWTRWPTGRTISGALARRGGDGEVVVLVAELPAPLEPDHLDADVGIGLHVGHVALDHRAEGEQDGDDHDRDGGVRDLQRDVVAALRRQLVVGRAAPVADEDVDQQHVDEQGDGAGGEEEAAPQLLDPVALLGGGVGDAEPRELAPRRHERHADDCSGGSPSHQR